MLFVATRNVVIAAGLAVIVILILGYLFNENSELCLWRTCITKPPLVAAGGNEGFTGLSPEEAMILKRLQDKQMAAASASASADAGDVKELKVKAQETTASSIYNSVLTQINSSNS